MPYEGSDGNIHEQGDGHSERDNFDLPYVCACPRAIGRLPMMVSVKCIRMFDSTAITY